jgi:hypothetical protein
MKIPTWRIVSVFCLLAAFLTACGSGAAGPQSGLPQLDAAPVVGDVEVYTAEDWRVELAHLTTENEALIRFFGSGGELDGVALVHTLEADDSGRRWVMSYRGRQRSVLYGRRRPDGQAPYQIHLPGHRTARNAEAQAQVLPTLGGELAQAYLEAYNEGKVHTLTEFDRAYETARQDEEFQGNLARTQEACGTENLSGTIVWDGVSDARLLETAVYSYCGEVFSSMRNYCGKDGGAAWLTERVDSVRCQPVETLEGDEDGVAVAREGNTLVVDVSLEASNVNRKVGAGLLVLADDAHGTFANHLAFHAASVCRDASGETYVLYSPMSGDNGEGELAYGSATEMNLVRQARGLGGTWFFDPRQFNEGNNSNFRGYNLQHYSHVEVDDDVCTVTCGEREISMTLVDGDAKAAIVALERQAPTFDREPFALARDRRGVYYYVDRGASEATASDFRLYRGRRGAMRQLDMEDVVTDSQGAVFESEAGTLRLVLDQDEALWVQRGRNTSLSHLPVRENLNVIFSELGVYLGVSLGTPCEAL